MLMIFIYSIKLFESISFVCVCLCNTGADVILVIMLKRSATYRSTLSIKHEILQQTRICVTCCSDDGCVSG